MFRIPAETRHFSLLRDVRLGSGTHLSLFSVVTFDVLARGLKQLGREADHIPSPTTDFKNSHSSCIIFRLVFGFDPYVPHNLIPGHGSPVPLLKLAPRRRLLMSCGSRKIAQIYMFE